MLILQEVIKFILILIALEIEQFYMGVWGVCLPPHQLGVQVSHLV